MSVTAGQGTTVGFGALATTLALFTFLVMLAVLGDRWGGHFAPLPDFAAYKQVSDRKAAFIEYLTPIVEYHNDRILAERSRLLKIQNGIADGRPLSYSQLRWLKQLADQYGVDWSEDQLFKVIQELSSRVDIVPVQLAVVQAAKESSWGRSRYAVQVNNMFGEWCYRKGCGIVPKDRSNGARHEVRRFPTVSASTRSYIHNLNSHRNYSSLRNLRKDLRDRGRDIEGGDLVEGLLLYSERRQQYVDEIRSMIKQYSYFLRQQARAGRVIKGA